MWDEGEIERGGGRGSVEIKYKARLQRMAPIAICNTI